MNEIQDTLLRSSRAARLSQIIRDLEEQPQDIKPAERKWFASLLYPFSADSVGDYRLTPAPDSSSVDGLALIRALFPDAESAAPDVEQLAKDLAAIGRLWAKLEKSESLDGDEVVHLLKLARLLRHHFLAENSVPSLGQVFPARPAVQKLSFS